VCVHYYLLHGKEKPEYAVFPEPYQAKDRFYFQEFEPLLKEELTYIATLARKFCIPEIRSR